MWLGFIIRFFLLFAGITATANEAETLNKAIASSSQKQQAIRKDIYPRVKVQHHVKILCMFYLFFKLIWEYLNAGEFKIYITLIEKYERLSK